MNIEDLTDDELNDKIHAVTNWLTRSTTTGQYLKSLTKHADAGETDVYEEDAVILNDLLDIAKADRDLFEAVLQLVRAKKGNKVDYQRRFVKRDRQRNNTAIAIEERLAGRKFTPAEKQALLAVKKKERHAAKAEFMKPYEDLPYQQRVEKGQEFWQQLADRLEQDFETAKTL